MTDNLRRLSAALLMALGLMALASTFWGVLARDPLLARPDNPRLVLEEQRILRGMIVDRYGVPLAYTRDEDGDGLVERVYPIPEAAFPLGYYSLRYGAAGAELIEDAHLRGDALLTPWQQYSRRLLNQSQAGGDVRLTIDSDLQADLDAALAGRQGAVVVLDLDTGEILAMVSSPRYAPNSLDADWNELSEASDAPLLNRALQGQYQPGAAFQPMLLGLALDAGLATPGDLSAPPGPAMVLGQRLPCAASWLASTTLADALIAGCPAPFAALGEDLGPERLQAMLTDFALEDEIGSLLGGALDTGAPEASAPPIEPGLLAIGQSEFTVTPLEMARIAAALGRQGLIPPVRLVQATREPGSLEWIDAPPQGASRATLSAATLITVQGLMRDSARYGAARAAHVDGLEVVGHSGLALAGPQGELLAWFIGSVHGEDQGYAIAVLIEDAENVTLAGQIAARAFSRLLPPR